MNTKLLSEFKLYYSDVLILHGFDVANIIEKKYTSVLSEILLLKIENSNSDILCVEFISERYSNRKNSHNIFFEFQDKFLTVEEKELRVQYYSKSIFGFEFDTMHQLLLSYFQAGLEKKIFVIKDPLILNNLPSHFIVEHEEDISRLKEKYKIFLKNVDYHPLLKKIVKKKKPAVSFRVIFSFDKGFSQGVTFNFQYIEKHNYNIMALGNHQEKESHKIIHFNKNFTRLSFLQDECEIVIQEQLDNLLNNHLVDLDSISQDDFDNIILTKKMMDY